jgi:hypothetical protein
MNFLSSGGCTFGILARCSLSSLSSSLFFFSSPPPYAAAVPVAVAFLLRAGHETTLCGCPVEEGPKASRRRRGNGTQRERVENRAAFGCLLFCAFANEEAVNESFVAVSVVDVSKRVRGDGAARRRLAQVPVAATKRSRRSRRSNERARETSDGKGDVVFFSGVGAGLALQMNEGPARAPKKKKTL